MTGVSTLTFAVSLPDKQFQVSWHAVDLRTGMRGPQVTVQQMGTVSRKIGEPTDVSGFAVLCYDAALDPDFAVYGVQTYAGAVPGWDEATLPGRAMLVAVDVDTDEPVWGGFVVRRNGSLISPWVEVDMVTLEGYLDRRYVKDHDYVNTAQGVIVNGILTGDAIPTGVQFIVDASSATPRDRTYFDDDDKTVLSALQELMGVDGGPEFTVDLEWADEDHTLLNRIVRVRDRIGATPALPARFEMPGPVIDGDFTEDYASDNGANDVMATSSGEGDNRPESAHQVATDLLAGGWVRYERRYTPSTSITEQATLDAHAASELAEVRDGLMQLTLQVRLDAGPRYGVDFHLGDDVTAALTCARFPEYVGPDGDRVPGYVKTVRCVAVEIDFDGNRLTPTLLEVG